MAYLRGACMEVIGWGEYQVSSHGGMLPQSGSWLVMWWPWVVRHSLLELTGVLWGAGCMVCMMSDGKFLLTWRLMGINGSESKTSWILGLSTMSLKMILFAPLAGCAICYVIWDKAPEVRSLINCLSCFSTPAYLYDLFIHSLKDLSPLSFPARVQRSI